MKALKVLNTIALAIPLALVILSSIDESFLFYAAVSTMATGFIQVVAGVCFWYEFPKNNYIKIYLALVILFFGFWFIHANLYCLNILTKPLIVTPLILCIYLSVIIYTKKDKS